jgi:subfamily B ATP-binding cassette protein MsbA
MSQRHSRTAVWPTLRRFFAYLRPYTGKLGVIFILLLVVTSFDLSRPYLIGKIIDRITVSNAWVAMLPLLGAFLFTVVGKAIALLGRNYLIQRTGMRVTCDMRIHVFAHLQKLSLRFYEERHTGRIVSRISSDTSAMHSMVTGASVNLIGDAITILGALVLLLNVNWKLALVTYSVLPFFIYNYSWHRRRLRIESRRHRRNWDRVLSFLNERIASNRLIKAFATEPMENEMFRSRIEADYTNYNRVVWRNTLLSVAADFLSGLGSLAVLGYGAYLAIHHIDGFTVGKLAAFNFYLGLLYVPITRMVDANVVIQQAATAMEKVFAVLDTQPHIPDNDNLPPLPAVRGLVEFDNVSFAYRPQQATLSGISFRVEPGEMIALVGPSGAGKSTIITLLCRFYNPTSGRVLIDGQDIREFNVQSLRRQVGIVMQDNILFSGSIADNIKYGRTDASQAEVIAAAQAANAHEFITKLRRGYNSEIGERGVQLSGGQRQRIAIARVILKDPRILILDEATSALDTQSERLIQEALEKLMKQRTSLVIAHRLSTVINADRILVMQAGEIVESGRHEELLRQGGLYQQLHSLQFQKAPTA